MHAHRMASTRFWHHRPSPVCEPKLISRRLPTLYPRNGIARAAARALVSLCLCFGALRDSDLSEDREVPEELAFMELSTKLGEFTGLSAIGRSSSVGDKSVEPTKLKCGVRNAVKRFIFRTRAVLKQVKNGLL